MTRVIGGLYKTNKPVKSCTIAKKFGVSIQQIMKTANWRTKGTFEKFCRKPVESETTGIIFQSAVLSP